MADNYFYPAIGLTGESQGDLDNYEIVADELEEGDGAIVILVDGVYIYYFDSTSTEATDSPAYIRPKDYVDGGVWVLINFAPGEFAVPAHAGDHLTGGDDPIDLATSSTPGLMSADDKLILSTPLDFKNKLINSNFKIWQRGTSVSSGTGYVTADRWFISTDGGTLTAQRSSINPGAIAGSESRQSIKLVATGVDGGANDYLVMTQRIENVRTLAGCTATFSFWAWCADAVKIGISFRQSFGTGGSPSSDVNFIPNEGSEITCVASTWTKFVVTVDVPSISGKTLGTAGDDYLSLLLWFNAGSDFEASPYFMTMGQQAAFGLTFYLTDLFLEKGAVETSYPDYPYSIEELRCYRYYWRFRPGQLSAHAYGDNAVWSWRFGPPCSMRTTPTASSVFTNCTYSFVDGMVWDVLESDEKNGGLLYYLSDYAGAKTSIYAKFSATDYIALSAEL